MASMLPIPYARQQAYRNPQYVAAMADLMMRRGDTASAAALMKGQNTQQLMQSLGAMTMGTFAGIGKQRDEERDRAILQAERDREYALKQQEMADRAADRKADSDYRQRTEAMALSDRREAAADKAVDRIQVGTEVPMSEMKPFEGTSAMSAFQKLPSREATLPARSIVDEKMGYSGLADPVEMNRAGEPPVAQTGETDWLEPTRRTMDTDYEARPERMKRIASQQELMQLETLRRQAEAAQQLANDRREDNAARDAAARATVAYQNKQIELSQARLNAAGSRAARPTTASLALAAAGGDPKKAMELIASQRDDPRKMMRFSALSGAYQRSPLVNASDRTVILDDAIKSIRANPGDAASQTQLAYAFVQVLDTYQSAVREGELRNIGMIDSVIGRLKRRAEGIAYENQVMNSETATSIADSSARIILAIEQARKEKTADFAARAKVEGIGDLWDEYRSLADQGRSRGGAEATKPVTSPFNDPNAQPKPRP